MSLFEVEGWNVPHRVITTSSKKRKRESHSEDFSTHVENKGSKQSKSNGGSHIPNARKKSKTDKSKNKKRSEKDRKDVAITPVVSKSDNAGIDIPSSKTKGHHASMTDLQASMKNSLEGAKFRWINEMLYTADSSKSYELMQKDPDIFQAYHSGFRHQVVSWPQNPVQHFISALSSSPPGTVVVDLGCGEAALAKSLIPRGICVLSYDLVRLPPYVMEADICQWIPLPGSEESEEGHVVDVCVCALSLMNTNWVGCIRQSWRILKMGGELKIAEVSSRFTDINAFINIISEIGFKLKLKDHSNTHFILLEFKKTSRKPMNENQWLQIAAKHDVLKPCEYRRR